MKLKTYKYPNQLKRIRRLRGMSYKKVARTLRIKNPHIIARWENGESIPRGKHLLQLRLLYDVPIEEMYADYLTVLANRLTE